MPILVCQRCGESSEGESYLLARNAMEHKEGCGPKVGPLVPSSKAIPHTVETQKKDQPEPALEEPKPEEPKPEAKKSKRKKKSEQSDS